MNGQPSTPGPGSTVTTPTFTTANLPVTMVPTTSLQTMMDLPTPPQAHQHTSQTSLPPPPAAHQQVMSMSPQMLSSGMSSGSSSPGLSPARHSPSPRSPGSPGTYALIYPGGGPIPLTVSHTSPIGKHGGTLGALTASVNALQRPISTAGLHAATSYPVVRTTLAPGSRAMGSIPLIPVSGPQPVRGARSPKQRVIMTTKTPIFRSHTIVSTTTAGLVGSTMPPGMVRVSPSTQAVRAQVQAQSQVQAQVQAQIHAAQIQQSRQQSSTGIPPMSPPIAILPSPTGAPQLRNPNPAINNPAISNAQAKLQLALANAAAKYRQQRSPQFGPLSPSSSQPPMGLVTPSVQARSKSSKSIPNPPAKSQTIKPAPHIPILPKSAPPSPRYTPIAAKPIGMTPGSHSKNGKPKPQHKKSTQAPGSQFKPMHSHSPGVRPTKKPAASLPTATVSATATVPHKATKVVAGKDITKRTARPEVSVRPAVNSRPEFSVRPEITVRPEVSVRTEVTVMSDVVTIKENGCIEKEVPRAIVRPQVLTHVIDGFIIEESKEPFPVSHSIEVPDLLPEQQQHKQQKKSSKPRQQQAPRQENGNNSGDEGNMLRCEFCGTLAPRRNFKRSMRFCSMSCAKRYNVGCSKRLGLFSPKREHPERVKHLVKLQTKAKPLKGSRGKHGRLSYNVNQPWSAQFSYTDDKSWPERYDYYDSSEWNDNPPPSNEPSKPPKQPQQQQHLERTDSTTSSSSSSSSSNGQSVSEETSSISVRAPSPSQVSEPDTTPASDDAFEDAPPTGTSSTDPGKWSVQEVFEFIRALPGCESYADEFQRQEIDGQALLLLKEDHLMTAMNMKLGPALKIINRINSLKDK